MSEKKEEVLQTTLPVQEASIQYAPVTPAKSNNNCLKFGCIGLGVLLLLCGVSSFAAYYFINQSLKQYASESPSEYAAKNFSYSQKPNITPTTQSNPGIAVGEPNGSQDMSILEKKLQSLSPQANTISLTQEEIVNSLPVEGIGLSISNGSMSLRADIQKLAGSGNLPKEISLLGNSVLYADIKTTADGKGLEITKLTTGNAIVDSMLQGVGKDLLLEAINGALVPQSISGFQLKKIELQEGRVQLEVEPDQTENTGEGM